jgi:hypothetical protein
LPLCVFMDLDATFINHHDLRAWSTPIPVAICSAKQFHIEP